MDPTTFSAQVLVTLGEVAAVPLLADKTIDIAQIAVIGEKLIKTILANPPVVTPTATPAPATTPAT